MSPCHLVVHQESCLGAVLYHSRDVDVVIASVYTHDVPAVLRPVLLTVDDAAVDSPARAAQHDVCQRRALAVCPPADERGVGRVLALSSDTAQCSIRYSHAAYASSASLIPEVSSSAKASTACSCAYARVKLIARHAVVYAYFIEPLRSRAAVHVDACERLLRHERGVLPCIRA